MSNKGHLFIMSAPSGSGKTSLASSVIRQISNLEFSVSHTTRAPRDGERDGVEYHFIGESEFHALIDEDAFLEWAHVYGNYYGTSRRFVEERRTRGSDVLLDIDVQGALKVKQAVPEATMVFVFPPSYQILAQRLRGRGLDDQRVIESRLEIARKEILFYRKYDYLVLNDDMDQAIDELESIIHAARCSRDRRVELAERVVSTFETPDRERKKR